MRWSIRLHLVTFVKRVCGKWVATDPLKSTVLDLLQQVTLASPARAARLTLESKVAGRGRHAHRDSGPCRAGRALLRRRNSFRSRSFATLLSLGVLGTFSVHPAVATATQHFHRSPHRLLNSEALSPLSAALQPLATALQPHVHLPTAAHHRTFPVRRRTFTDCHRTFTAFCCTFAAAPPLYSVDTRCNSESSQRLTLASRRCSLAAAPPLDALVPPGRCSSKAAGESPAGGPLGCASSGPRPAEP